MVRTETLTLSPLLLSFLPCLTAEPPVRGADVVARDPGAGQASPGGGFEVPKEAKDQHGNAVKKGSDERTGWPLEIRHKATGMHLVFIAAGEFQMGRLGPDEFDPERPMHDVKITKPFYLGKCEVTQAEWQKVMGLPAAPGTCLPSPGDRQAAQAGNNPSRFRGATNPVEQVSWEDCQEFMKKLNGALPSTFGRGAGGEGAQGPQFALPTEAQWEYACRAGTTTRFSFGDQDNGLGEYAWYGGNSDGKTHSVGGRKANPWGLYDMHGNVSEWCQDRLGENPKGDVVDPPGIDRGSYRVVRRGGTWDDSPMDLHSADWYWGTAGNRDNFSGCRVALNLD